MFKKLSILFLLSFCLTAGAQFQIQTTPYSRAMLTNSTAQQMRDYLGVSGGNADWVFVGTNGAYLYDLNNDGLTISIANTNLGSLNFQTIGNITAGGDITSLDGRLITPHYVVANSYYTGVLMASATDPSCNAFGFDDTGASLILVDATVGPVEIINQADPTLNAINSSAWTFCIIRLDATTNTVRMIAGSMTLCNGGGSGVSHAVNGQAYIAIPPKCSKEFTSDGTQWITKSDGQAYFNLLPDSAPAFNTWITNGFYRSTVESDFHLISTSASVAKVSLIVEQGNGITNTWPLSITNTTFDGKISGMLQPLSRFMFTNQSAGSSTATFNSYAKFNW